MLKKIIAAAFLAALAAPSFSGTRGVYVGLDAGSTKVNDFSDRGTSYGAVVGYNFNQYFALEGGYRRLGTWESGPFSLKIDESALSAIGIVPLGNGFNIYGRFGHTFLHGSVSGPGTSYNNSDGALYGVGVGYSFSENVGARLEVRKPSTDSTNISVGVNYSF